VELPSSTASETFPTGKRVGEVGRDGNSDGEELKGKVALLNCTKSKRAGG